MTPMQPDPSHGSPDANHLVEWLLRRASRRSKVASLDHLLVGFSFESGRSAHFATADLRLSLDALGPSDAGGSLYVISVDAGMYSHPDLVGGLAVTLTPLQADSPSIVATTGPRGEVEAELPSHGEYAVRVFDSPRALTELASPGPAMLAGALTELVTERRADPAPDGPIPILDPDAPPRPDGIVVRSAHRRGGPLRLSVSVPAEASSASLGNDDLDGDCVAWFTTWNARGRPVHEGLVGLCHEAVDSCRGELVLPLSRRGRPRSIDLWVSSSGAELRRVFGREWVTQAIASSLPVNGDRSRVVLERLLALG